MLNLYKKFKLPKYKIKRNKMSVKEIMNKIHKRCKTYNPHYDDITYLINDVDELQEILQFVNETLYDCPYNDCITCKYYKKHKNTSIFINNLLLEK